MTPRDYDEKMRKERRTAFRVVGADGPLICLLKWAFGLDLFHAPIEWFARPCLSLLGTLDRSGTEEEAKAEFRKVVEWYWLGWTLLLAKLYVLAIGFSRSGMGAVPGPRPFFVLLALVTLGLIATYRIVEILATTFRLHVLTIYKTTAFPHALVLTGLAYVHVLMSFGILFLADSYLDCDGFGAKGFLGARVVDAAYFSAVTISTLGYGDMSPRQPAGKILIIAEVFTGLVLLIVTLQRLLAGVVEDKNKRP